MAKQDRFLLFTSLSLLLTAFSITAVAAPLSANTQSHSPITISKRNDIRVVYDVGNNETDAGVGRALFYIRGLVDNYRKLGLKPENYRMSVVVHGAAGYWLLNDENYQKRQLDPFGVNPNEQLIRDLQEHGVSIELCSATMREKGWTQDDLLPGIIQVHDAYSRIIDLQVNQHYAYVYF